MSTEIIKVNATPLARSESLHAIIEDAGDADALLLSKISYPKKKM